MLTVLSPAKTLDFDTPPITKSTSKPALIDHSAELIDDLRELSAARISSLMSISEKLGVLNRDRYASWDPTAKADAKQAILAFKGDVYRGLDATRFSEEDLQFAQKHLRILSGLYGILRPLDLIQPYRLEMGTQLGTDRGTDLYQFWDDRITAELNKQLRSIKSNTLVNLASIEYFKSVKTDKLKADVVAPVFLDLKNDKYKIISFYAKKARGIMSGWIIQKRIEDATQLKKFKVAGYRYSAEMSEPDKPAFIRDQAE